MSTPVVGIDIVEMRSVNSFLHFWAGFTSQTEAFNNSEPQYKARTQIKLIRIQLIMDTFGNHARRDARRREREQHMARMDELVSSELTLWDDDEPIAPSIGEARMRQAEEAHGSLWTSAFTRVSRRSCIAILCIIPVIAIAAGFAFGKDVGEHGNGHVYNIEPEIENDNRYSNLFNVILDWEVTPKSALEDDRSAQWRALQWLAYADSSTTNIEAVRTRYALATLYYSTHNVATEGGTLRSWHDETHWLSSYPVCLWHGVECHDEDNTLERVKSLNLTSNGMGGTLPDELSMLELDIHFLDISDNGFEGVIPESITKMRNLRKSRSVSVLSKVILSALTHKSLPLLPQRDSISVQTISKEPYRRVYRN